MISQCCYEEDRSLCKIGPDFSNVGICPKCFKSCQFVNIIEFQNGEVVEIIQGEFYSNGVKIKDEALIYELEQILGADDESPQR